MSRTRQANGWQTSRPIPRHGHIRLHRVFQRLKVQIEDKRLLYPLLVLASAFMRVEIIACTLSDLQVRKPPFRKLSLPFGKPYMPSLTSDHQVKSSCDPPFRILCLFIAKKYLSSPFGSSSVISLAFSSSPLQLTALEMVWTAMHIHYRPSLR